MVPVRSHCLISVRSEVQLLPGLYRQTLTVTEFHAAAHRTGAAWARGWRRPSVKWTRLAAGAFRQRPSTWLD